MSPHLLEAHRRGNICAPCTILNYDSAFLKRRAAGIYMHISPHLLEAPRRGNLCTMHQTCYVSTFLKRSAAGRMKRSYLGGLRVNDSPTKVTLFTWHGGKGRGE